MPFSGIADSQQLDMLATVLAEYCLEAGIGPADAAREDAARLIVSLYGDGMDTEEKLRAGLAGSAIRRHRVAAV